MLFSIGLNNSNIVAITEVIANDADSIGARGAIYCDSTDILLSNYKSVYVILQENKNSLMTVKSCLWLPAGCNRSKDNIAVCAIQHPLSRGIANRKFRLHLIMTTDNGLYIE